MEGFGVHTSMWTMNWDRAGAEKAIAAAVDYKMDFIEIALLDAHTVLTSQHAAHLDAQGQDRRAEFARGLEELEQLRRIEVPGADVRADLHALQAQDPPP